jgi:microcompartment protein CcmK/EutM
MYIAEVIGSVVATRKTTNMERLPLRLVRRVTTDLSLTETYAVVVDVIGADTGEYVLITTGSSARNTHLTDNRPVDAVIMAIVDTWQVGDSVRYTRIQPD